MIFLLYYKKIVFISALIFSYLHCILFVYKTNIFFCNSFELPNKQLTGFNKGIVQLFDIKRYGL